MSEADRIPPAWREWFEERAAILEHDAGFLRVDAEKEATRLLQEYLAYKANGRAREAAFRETLTALVMDRTLALPAALHTALVDHLSRTDAQGFSLCFTNPERHLLLDRLWQWAEPQGGTVATTVRALIADTAEGEHLV